MLKNISTLQLDTREVHTPFQISVTLGAPGESTSLLPRAHYISFRFYGGCLL